MNDNDPTYQDWYLMEIFLSALGVASEAVERERGPREPKEIDEIISKLQEWR